MIDAWINPAYNAVVFTRKFSYLILRTVSSKHSMYVYNFKEDNVYLKLFTNFI